jgi:hypothetical protein
MEADSWARYKGVMCRIVCIVHRTKQRPKEERPPYAMTSAQRRYWKGFAKACGRYQAMQEHQATLAAEEDRREQDESRANEDIRKQTSEMQESCRDMCARFIIAMLDHSLGDHQYDNVLIGTLAVMGVRDDGGWQSALDYTPILSAVIKVARKHIATGLMSVCHEICVRFMVRLRREDFLLVVMAEICAGDGVAKGIPAFILLALPKPATPQRLAYGFQLSVLESDDVARLVSRSYHERFTCLRRVFHCSSSKGRRDNFLLS